MISNTNQRIKYIAADFISTVVAIAAFEIARYYFLADIPRVYGNLSRFLRSEGIVATFLIMPPLLMLVYSLTGYYVNAIFRSRAEEFLITLLSAAIASLLMFFGALLDDSYSPATDYKLMAIFFILLIVCLYLPRVAITSHMAHLIHSRKWSMNTVMVGPLSSTSLLADKLSSMRKPMGYEITGCTESTDTATIRRLVEETDAKAVIITGHSMDDTLRIINSMYSLGLPLLISPADFPWLMSFNRFDNIAGEPLVNLSSAYVAPSTHALKRFSDILISAMALIILSPVMAAIALAVKLDSPGPVFYSQERLGRFRRPFRIWKFRSMTIDAEKDKPKLSSKDDPRITRVGHFMRKYRLDELPNFWNVLRGEMSLVGPRPERPYFVNLIMEQAPVYSIIHQVRPGITSWGMVKYGYASDLGQMLERMKYDLTYLNNISVATDLKILFYTIHTVVTGRGI